MKISKELVRYKRQYKHNIKNNVKKILIGKVYYNIEECFKNHIRRYNACCTLACSLLAIDFNRSVTLNTKDEKDKNTND